MSQQKIVKKMLKAYQDLNTLFLQTTEMSGEFQIAEAAEYLKLAVCAMEDSLAKQRLEIKYA